jgi:hypothetical protein
VALATVAFVSAAAAASRVEIDSIGCIETSAPGHPAHGSCTYVLTDGRRFKCPLRFSNHRQTPASLQRARACRRLSSIKIPASWRRVFARLYAVQACLTRHHITANGGPTLDALSPRRTPIGELITSTTRPTAFIAFYTTARVAKRAETGVRKNARQFGGRVERRGAVTIVWTQPPSASLGTTTEACAFS